MRDNGFVCEICFRIGIYVFQYFNSGMADKIVKSYPLNNEEQIPAIGFGTWQLIGKDNIRTMIQAAIQKGYRHFDLAHVYENEKDIGDVLSEILEKEVVTRDELFITSKIWNTYHDNVDLAIETTLKNLRLDYLDLYLVHWPVSAKPDANFNEIKDQNKNVVLNEFNLKKLWADMERLVETGKTRSIGVCNFGLKNMKSLLSFCKIKPVCLQIEMHPFLKQEELLKLCDANFIVITAYSSLRCIPDINDRNGKVIIDIAKKYGCSVASVIINYLLSKNVVVINKTSRPERLEENMRKVKLSESDINLIDEIKEEKRYIDPKWFGEARFD
ncbi:Aldo/keto reductase family protein [Trachipleistophora hominis]|uniref:Aldo/keto reductase family protein n=1 Tax=Trachipleistophora hominis TaxID=72359 RepID=L7K044_TRAHO|nr:Aldo/keto reductase family protein [Trachipleistophora hominis]